MSVGLEPVLPLAPPAAPVGQRTPPNPSGLDYAYAALLTLALGLLLVASTPALWHWFVLPCGICGVMIGGDAVRWARGRTGLLDPIGLIGVIGYHFFFTGPLLNVRWDQWPPGVAAPGDWRPWLGAMALLNLVGLVIYRVTLAAWAGRARVLSPHGATQRKWRLDPERLWPAVLLALAISAATEAFALVAVGGFGGFTAAVVGQSSLAGFGWMLALGESFPLLCFLAWLMHARLRRRRVSTPALAFGFGVFIVAQFVVGGLRGSRGNLIWPAVMALGVVHLTVRPISRRTLVVAAAFGLVFMYFYGFYKYGGLQAATDVFQAHERSQLEQQSGRTIPLLLLQDLGRADIQAFILYRYDQPDSQYTRAWGRTYVAGLAVMVPHSIWPNRPPGKLKNGTDLMYGVGTFDRGIFYSQNIYGLAGEALLNFGVAAIPISFVALGLVVRRAQRFASRLDGDDSRQYLVPLVGVLCILFLTSDFGNVVFAALQFGLLPTAVVMVGSRRARAAA